jgi:DNA-binding response OmpR family regulator
MLEVPKKNRVLIVEDEAAIQQVLSFFLKHNGFETHAVSNGLEAIRIIPEFDPHLIILDLIMRPVSGWDVLHWLRTNHLTPPLPVLVLSALVNLTEQMQGLEEGAVEYITKPTQPSIIVERVRTILSLSEGQREMLQHRRMDERRKILERLRQARQMDEFVY